MAQSRETIYVKDMSGGLNLSSQVQSLRAPGTSYTSRIETPDCLNVDFTSNGGFVTRGGFETQGQSAAFEDAHFLGATYFAADVLLMTSYNQDLLHWNGSTLTDTGEDLSDVANSSDAYHIQMAVHENTAYFANGRLSGNLVMRSWDGSTLTTLTNTFNNDYTTPDGGDMPLARYIAFHQGYMWVADTVESAVRHPQRVRFSHLQNPEDWATADYFDVDPFDDGDPIVALVPFASYLLIFKRSSVWAVYGSDKDTFSLERIQMGAGVNSAHGVAVSENVAYWFSNDGRLMGFNGQRIVPVMDKLSWWSETGRIKHGGDHDLMWLHGKLWMALETGAGETNDSWLFIWDPQIDALTRYDKSVVEMYNWWRIEQDADPLFLFESTDEMFRFDGSYSFDTVIATGTLTQVDDVTDIEGVDGVAINTEGSPVTTNVRIDAYYRTPWITAGETGTKKRWKRPRITAAAEGNATIKVEVFHNFNEFALSKESTFIIDGYDGSQWGSMVWGEDSWGSGNNDNYAFARQPSAGSGQAVQFRFSSSNNAGRWWVDSIALPFRRRQIR